jgi:hypothetical protein
MSLTADSLAARAASTASSTTKLSMLAGVFFGAVSPAVVRRGALRGPLAAGLVEVSGFVLMANLSSCV